MWPRWLLYKGKGWIPEPGRSRNSAANKQVFLPKPINLNLKPYSIQIMHHTQEILEEAKVS